MIRFTSDMIRFIFVFSACLAVVILARHVEQKPSEKDDVKSIKTPCTDKECINRHNLHDDNSNKNHKKIHKGSKTNRRRHRKISLQPVTQDSLAKRFGKSSETHRTLPGSTGYTLQKKVRRENVGKSSETHRTLPGSTGYTLQETVRRENVGKSSETHRTLPGSTGYTLQEKARSEKKNSDYRLQAEDSSLLYKNYGWDTEAKVPRGVARLENKMHPNIRHAAKEFMDNLQTVLHRIQGQIRRVDDEYISVGMNARDAMMSVREELQLITHENDKAYDTMLDVSQLVRYVYRRAHEHGLAGSEHNMALTRVPEISHLNLHNHLSESEHANYSASIALHRVMDLKQRGIQQDESKSSIMKKVKEASLSEQFRYYEIYDLRQRCRHAILKADVLATNVLIPVRKRIMRYKMSKTNISEKIHHAKYLTGLAHESTKTSRDTYMISKKYHDNAMRNGRQVRRRRSTDQITMENRLQKALLRTKQIQHSTDFVRSTLKPLVLKAKAVANKVQSGTSGIISEVRGIVVKMVSSLSKLDDKVDELRVFLNDSLILEARCEELDGSSSVIQCDKYGMFEGSGSGAVDDEDLFTNTPTSTKTTTDQTTKFTSDSTATKLATKTPESLESTTSMSKSTVVTTTSTTSPSTTTTTPSTTSISTTTTTPTTTSTSTTTTKPSTTSISTTTTTPTTTLSSTTTTTPTTTSTLTTTTTPTTTSTTTSTTLTTSTTTSTSTSTTTSMPTTTSTLTTTTTPTTTSTSTISTTLITSTTTSTSTSTTTTTPTTSTTTTTPTTTSTSTTTTTPTTTPTPTTTTTAITTSTSSTTITPSSTPKSTTTFDGNEVDGSGEEISGSGVGVPNEDFIFEPTTTEVTLDMKATVTSTTPEQSIISSLTSTQSTTTMTSTTVGQEEESGKTEEDFIFDENDEDKKEDKNDSWLSSWWSDDPNILYDHRNDFKDKLSKKAQETRKISETTYHNWMSVSGRSQDLTFRWDNVTHYIQDLQRFVYAAEGLKINWNTDATTIITKIHTTIPNRTVTVSEQANMANTRSENALNIINDKLDAMLILKKEKLSTSDGADSGPAFMADLIVNVQKAQQNSKEIVRLRQTNSSPCSSVQNTATRLRNSIAKLRSKIEQAKTIATSIPLTIELSENQVVRASVFSSPLPVSATSSIEMCIKPSSDNMHVASFHGNSSQVYSLSLENSKPVMTVTATDGSVVGRVSFDSSDLTVNDWYSVSVTRYGRTIEVKTKKLNDTQEDILEKSYLPEIESYHSPITEVLFGKTTSDTPPFSGCIGDLMINGKMAALFQDGGKLQQCNGDSCNSTDKKSMIFEGDGFVKFSPNLIDASYIDNINIRFQTHQKDAVILFFNDKQKHHQVLITLREGGIHIEVRSRRGSMVRTSVKKDYSDNRNHFIKVLFGTDIIDVTTDISDDQFEQELVRQEMASRIPDGIYLGGLDVQSHSLSGKTKLRSFAGCLSEVRISNRELTLSLHERSRNVYYGMCSQNLWKSCVQFTDKSTPIKFPTSGDYTSLSVVFGRESTGTLLNMQRINGEDFDFSFIYDGKSIEILDNKVKDIKYKMTADNQDKDWHVLTLQDTDNEELKVTVDFTYKALPYDIPWRWFPAELVYDVTIGGLPESQTSTFLGSVSDITLSDRKANLGDLMSNNMLQHCEKTFSNHLQADIEEKPVC